jgi:5-methylcytosine-specific restriction protein A
MPAQRCNQAGCYTIVRSEVGSRPTPRCEAHTKVKRVETNELRYAGNNVNAKLYNSSRWRRLSKKIRQIRPFCEDCWDNGQEVVGDVVDHIREISDGGDPFSTKNLRVLCHQCHNTKTAKEKRKRAKP